MCKLKSYSPKKKSVKSKEKYLIRQTQHFYMTNRIDTHTIN